MKKIFKTALLLVVGILLPFFGRAQEAGAGYLKGVLDNLYNEMMPLCGQLLGVAQGIAGFAATWYIGSRIWRHIANAEPVDFYPLLRPFALGFCIMIFPSVLGVLNGVLQPTVTATASMVENSNKTIEQLLKDKEAAIKKSSKWQMYVGDDGSGDKAKWYKYYYGEELGDQDWVERLDAHLEFHLEKVAYNFQNSVKEWMSVVLRVLFEAAALCIDTMRTFQLIVLSILGPLVFAFAVFDGFEHTLSHWLARYINIFLWLPIANIFSAMIGRIYELMIKLDISQIEQHGDTLFSRTDMAYLIFLVIGIIGYWTVPSLANFIVQAGNNGFNQKVTNVFGRSMPIK